VPVIIAHKGYNTGITSLLLH